MKNYKYLLLYIVLCVVPTTLFNGCSPKSGHPSGKDLIQEGVIHFKIEYPNLDTSKSLLKSVIPHKMKFFIKDGKFISKIIGRGDMFTLFMLGKPAKDSLSLGLKFGMEKVVSELTSKNIEAFKNDQPELSFESSEDTVTMAGFLCKKQVASYKTETGTKQFDVFYTEAIAAKNFNWFTPYSSINGMLLRYEVEYYGMRMRLIAKSFENKKVKDEQFKIDKSEFQIFSYEKFNTRMDRIFGHFSS